MIPTNSFYKQIKPCLSGWNCFKETANYIGLVPIRLTDSSDPVWMIFQTMVIKMKNTSKLLNYPFNMLSVSGFTKTHLDFLKNKYIITI